MSRAEIFVPTPKNKNQTIRAAGLMFESTYLFLDHLAPFCALLGWPLIIVDPQVRELAEQYYPGLEIIETSMPKLQSTLQSFTHLATCASRPLLLASIGPIPCKTIWLPHGNSDKGRIFPFFDVLRDENLALIYGQKMADFLKDERVDPPVIRIGQYRYLYYQKWREFYDDLPIAAFSQKQPTVLYAPTWEDSENNCSFWKAFPTLAKHLPDSFNLIVKLHPNTVVKNAPEIERLIGKYQNGRLQFLLDFPPIFALLNRCDYYLGDRSSIGYDFLRFDRPLFFLDPHDHQAGRELTSCGTVVSPENFHISLMQKDNFSAERRRMNAYTFDNISLADLQRSIRNFCIDSGCRQDKNCLQIH